MRSIVAVCFVLAASTLAQSADLPVEIQAKLVKIASEGTVACKDATMAKAIQAIGATVNPDADFAYAATETEVKTYVAARKLVICPRAEWLGLGATLAVIDDNNRPNVLLNMRNMNQSKGKLSDSFRKIAKQLP